MAMMKKRVLSVLLLLLLALSACAPCATHTAALQNTAYGDLDGDGVCGAYDVVLLLQHFAGVRDLSNEVLRMADVNGDGKQTTGDALLMQQHQVGKYTSFPVDCKHSSVENVTRPDGTVTRACTLCGTEMQDRIRVAYLPLDDRPVNKERVLYLAQSVGIELVMPEDWMYRTALDNMQPNPNGLTIGDREALLAWMKEADKTCDYFILSLDQALSGGLVGSRWLCNTDLTLEYDIMDEIIHLCKTNTVVMFDTVMRLASTVGYQGYDLDTYNALRNYGFTARKQLQGNQLTIENIVAGYRYDENGNRIPDPVSETKMKQYLGARERKLKLADYILRNVKDDVEFLYIGVDDSNPRVTIQSNEIAYLRSLLGDKGVLSAAADELGMCCLTRLVTKLYGNVDIKLSYFGSGEHQPADSFDIGTLGENVDTHLTCLNAKKSASGGLHALILTRFFTESDCVKLMDTLERNLQNGVPTVLLDVSGSSTLSGMLVEHSDAQLGLLLGYSSWNTAGNAMGIALSMGIARYSYLMHVEQSTPDANEGFLKSMTFAYIKDISYKRFHAYLDGLQSESNPCSVPLILRRLNASKLISSLQTYTESECGAIRVSNFRYPWNRTFEMTFDIDFG